MELYQLQNMNLDLLKDFCQKNKPSKGQPSGHPESYDTNAFPDTWNKLLEFHWTQWGQRETPAAQPPLAQNHSPDDRETRTTTTEVETRSSIDSLYRRYWA
jgi:hypothetical protein